MKEPRGIKERLVAAMFGDVIEKVVQERLPAASASTDDEAGWRKLTGDATRTLSGVTQERQIEIAYWLWKNNPLANWIIEIMTAFIVGDGITVEAENEEVKTLLTEFWKHPINNFPLMLEKYVKELGIYGSQCWPKFVSQHSGKVALGYIDPAQIKAVVTDPQNVKIVIGVTTRGKDFRDGRKYKTVLPPEAEEFLSPDAQAWRDAARYECFYFAINNVTNDPYGTSDLFVIADWLDAYEQFLFDYADKWPLLNTFVWDLMVKDGTKESIEEQMKAFTKKSGSIYGHNDKVVLEPSTPDLKAVDADEGAKLIRNHILGAKSIPSFWYGGAQDSNIAVSQEMSAPTYKMFSARQRLIIYILTGVLNEVIREADAHGMLTGVTEEEKVFKLNAPEMASKDISKFSTAIQQLTTSLVAAVSSSWIDQETACKLYAFSISLIGYELDVDAIKGKLEAEAETKGYEDYLKKQTTPDPSLAKRGAK